MDSEHTSTGWLTSTVLLGLGGIAAVLAILLALWGAFDNPGEAASTSLVAAATPIALGGVGLTIVGGVLRFTCCWEDCEWDEEDDAASATTAP